MKNEVFFDKFISFSNKQHDYSVCKWRVYYGEYSMNEQVGNATTVEDCAKECKDNFECKGFNLFQNKCSTFTEIKSKKKASSDMYIWICGQLMDF